MPVHGPQGPELSLSKVPGLTCTSFLSLLDPSPEDLELSPPRELRLGAKWGFCESRWEASEMFAQQPLLCPVSELMPASSSSPAVWGSSPTSGCMPPPLRSAGFSLLILPVLSQNPIIPICLFLLIKGHCKGKWAG